MTTQEIIEGNKLIAKFMGLSYCTKYQYEGWYKNSEHNHRICDFDGLKFNSSWDWLMPVVNKIESLPLINDAGLCVLIEHSYCRIYLDNWGEYTTVVEKEKKKDKLNAVYLSIVEFIKWYNQNK